MPKNERPRERLARLGASSVSDAELLAIFLRVGVKGSSAIEVGRKLLKKHGSLSELGGLTVRELSLEHGLGPAKAAQLLAAFELGARTANEKMARTPMNSPDAIYDAVAPRMAYERKEHVLIILLDSKLCAIRMIELSVGRTDSWKLDLTGSGSSRRLAARRKVEAFMAMTTYLSQASPASWTCASDK